MAPAIEAARVDVNDGLKERGSASSGGFGPHRSVLVITETALACILLIGAGLAMKSLWSLRNVELGFNSANVLTFRIAAPCAVYRAAHGGLLSPGCRTNSSVPGVQSAAVARDLPNERHGSFDAHRCGR